MSDRLTILCGDAVEQLRTLPEASVQTCVTSPPYWGLRDYGVAGQIGLERTPEEWVDKLVGVFAEVWRVLRGDGTLWLNVGDCYGSGTAKGRKPTQTGKHGYWENPAICLRNGAAAKQLLGLPWRLAFALQAVGWYLRCDIVWHKPNPMPESVTDRPTRAHEFVFLLSKRERYYYDAEAVKEAVTGNAHERGNGVNPKAKTPGVNSRIHQDRDPGHSPARKSRQNESFSAAVNGLVGERNKRSVWTVATAPYPEAHFATYPEELIKPCILAGTSAAGCCVDCGAPLERVVVKGEPNEEWKRRCGADGNGEYHGQNKKRYQEHKAQPASTVKARILAGMVERKTVRWSRSCDCAESPTVPCTVLDPFAGSGTTGKVALELGRRAVLVELNPQYVKLIERGCDVTPGLAL